MKKIAVLLGITLLVFCLAPLLPSPAAPLFAWAADTAKPIVAAAPAPAAASPMADVLTSLMSLIAVVLSGLAAWALKLLAAKLKLSVDDQQVEMLRKVARDGIYFAEEWGAKQFKLTERAAAGSDKLAAAVQFVTARLPGVDGTEAAAAIHAVLGSMAGLGASKEVGETIATLPK